MSLLASPKDSALVVVDVQERLIAAMRHEDQAAMARNVPILLRAAAAVGVPAIVTEQYPKGLGATVEPVREALSAETPVIEKLVFSCGRSEPFRDALTATERKTAIVCGMEAHVCVLQTVADLIEQGYSVHVVADAVSSRTEDNRRVGLDLARQMGAVVTSTETVAFQWVGGAGTDAFKVVSKLVK